MAKRKTKGKKVPIQTPDNTSVSSIVSIQKVPSEFSDLTAKQRSFVIHYLMHGNGVAAAKAAGYRGSYDVLGHTAEDNLKKPQIRAAIDFVIKPKLAQAGVTVERVVDKLADVSFAPWRDFVKVKMNEEGEVVNATVLLKDQIAALRILADYLGMLKGDGGLSQHLHLHFPKENITAEEARQELLGFLRSRHQK